MTPVKLKGMTWSHPRGYDPMIACSKIWFEKTGVEVAWDKRSLQDFESFPVQELAKAYDLIVVDHPHVGEITSQNCLCALDLAGREAERRALEEASVGASYSSYAWAGHQWAFPIDAAAQVQAWRPDLLAGAPGRFEEVMALAKDGKVLIPMRPPHSLMTFYTLAANLGTPCANTGPGPLISEADGSAVYDLMMDLVRLVPDECFEMDPIAVSEKMSAPGSPYACAPLIYGYVNYAIPGFRSQQLTFSDIPAAGAQGPAGSALGGTGIAVSAFSDHQQQAIDFAYWIASGPIQRGPFANAGGQPGHAEGWEDEAVNSKTNAFYRNTRKTLEAAWVRPRHRGYMTFQAEASERLNTGLQSGERGGSVIAALNTLFLESFG